MTKRVKIIGRKAKEPILTASSLFATAVHFYESAKIIQSVCLDLKGKPNLKYFKARYFLLGHAIETGLKAFLFLNGRTKDNLKKKKQHNLSVTLADAESLGLSCLNDAEKALVADLNKHYFNKDFEYEEVDYSKLPVLLELQQLTGNILSEIKKEIKKK